MKFLIPFCLITLIQAQIIDVNLSGRTVTDDNGFHLVAFYDEPIESLILPEIEIDGLKFFDLFYSRDIDDDEIISVIVLKSENHDLLYIDINNDEDLTNDNSPFVFPLDENEFTFDIVSPKDPEQFVRLQLRRRLIFSDEKKQNIIDSLFYYDNGDLKTNIYLPFSMKSPSFKGLSGTYYFDDRMTLGRGEIYLSRDTIKVGLFDLTNNGLFNDVGDHEGDVLIIDLNKDGYLSYSNSSEVFSLDETFEINNNNYKLSSIDPYGRFFTLILTDSPPDFRFLKALSNSKSDPSASVEFNLDESFWEYNFTNLGDQTIKAHSLRNEFILLNFWGEWCKPCIYEIPELLEINKQKKITIISFLKTNNLADAKKIIQDEELDWYHLKLNTEIETKFNIIGYPTNILVSRDGQILFVKNQINRFDVLKFLEN